MDISLIRFTWGTLVCWLIILFLLAAFVIGIKTGRVHCGDPASIYSKEKHPKKFWMLIFLFLLFIILSFVVWQRMVMGVL